MSDFDALDYTIFPILKNDAYSNRQMDLLLEQEGIRRDSNLDYSCGLFDGGLRLAATGSCFRNTLRCLAVSRLHQREGLMNRIVTHLTQVQFARGNSHLFLYSKYASAEFFRDLGFYEIAGAAGNLVFMENRRDGFTRYLRSLAFTGENGTVTGGNASSRSAAIVLNGNPFTLGHQFLVEKAASDNDAVHLFIVSEDVSLIPFTVRKKLVMEGTAHLPGLVYHDSGPYIISNATFPSYFQKSERDVIEGHARLDLAIFKKIAGYLGITRRYVGEEPNSLVTGIYNQVMKTELPKAGIECIEAPRIQRNGTAISASTVRSAIRQGDMKLLSDLVPDSTLQYFLSPKAMPVIEAIKKAGNVIHY